jgi:hypothetical protein
MENIGVLNLKVGKIMKYSMKIPNRIAHILILGLLAGCIPYPHTTQRLAEVRGRVLDANTHAPIGGAKVFLTDHPNFSCKTDSSGSFHLKEIVNFHLGGIPPEGDWPARQWWWPHITVSHTNYIQREINNDYTEKGDIFLDPKQ